MLFNCLRIILRKYKMRCVALFCVVALVCGALAKNAKRDDGKVKIAVYYEALCPDSKRFVSAQLAPAWRDFRGAIKVKMVPYGKTTRSMVDGKWQFNCHHGPDECYGNKIQACILKNRALPDTQKMELVICLMSQTHPDKSLDHCMSSRGAGAEAARVAECARGAAGDALLAAAGDKSDAAQRPLAFVPTVVINEQFDQALQDEAQTNLKAIICRLAVNKPAVC